ncbi:MAG: ABC transporter permease [Candidatus Pacebacteria bacterium]|nr:ABC transporter permease [Candidatus Paceibacterota bacterium]
MKIIDLLYLSSQNIKTRKSRFLFTILGVSIGVGAILFLVSLGLGLQRNLHDSITTKDSLLTLDIVTQEEQIVTLNAESIRSIQSIAGVEIVSPQVVLPSQISLSGKKLTSEATFNIVDTDFLRLSGLMPKTQNEEETFMKNSRIIVNSSVAELFNLEPEELLGQKVTFIVFLSSTDEENVSEIIPHSVEHIFTINGVIPETPGSPGQVYVDRNYISNDIPFAEYQFAKVKVADDKQMELVREKLIERGYLVSSLSDTIAQADKIFGVIQIVLGIFGIVALFVAAIGLVNTMTISLLERTQEIGIMRAIGAPPKDIQRLFLGESFLTGFLGGFGGVFIGVVAGETFNFLVNIIAKTLEGEPLDLFYYDFQFMALIIALSSLVGLIAGIWPAHRAAKLNPIDALRYK